MSPLGETSTSTPLPASVMTPDRSKDSEPHDAESPPHFAPMRGLHTDTGFGVLLHLRTADEVDSVTLRLEPSWHEVAVPSPLGIVDAAPRNATRRIASQNDYNWLKEHET